MSRLQQDVIQANPWLVIVGLGGNDFLQEVPLTQTEQNLRQAVQSVLSFMATAIHVQFPEGRSPPSQVSCYYLPIARGEGSFMLKVSCKPIKEPTQEAAHIPEQYLAPLV